MLGRSRVALSPETAKGDYTMNSIELNVEGMSCGSCVKHINAALRPVAGVDEVTVDLPSGLVTVSGDTDSGLLIAALREAGYLAHLVTPRISAGTKKIPSSGSGCCCH